MSGPHRKRSAILAQLTAVTDRWAFQFYANMRLPHISHVADFSHISAKCAYIAHFFPHKLAFLAAAILINLKFFVFLFESTFNL